MAPDLSFEKQHEVRGQRCVGADEVGRGCLAGPVVAAAVLLPENLSENLSASPTEWTEINDSKLLSASRRERLAKFIHSQAHVQIAWCFPHEIDQYNILHASMVAMRRALRPFAKHANVLLVDGHLNPYAKLFKRAPEEGPGQPFAHVEPLVKGDQRSLSIAAASIVAKVHRDQWMTELDGLFPGYAFAKHKGYSTPEHYRAIESLGACPIHRLSFAPFKAV